ncbi:uncharacterized protein K489DRAFT_378508 [Dissoconium aciculare CBS 342.82]|uniref:Uncharacterized protein n=1 Tax=Dissoconium aciculare CBS 342.82 TaxID=1314786 RepID=A0A6J3M7Z3_9PEZI|nr:uncharacterized protein K489DRAFT_378508 [Dissoconium aciculare CBS 342.82]KAF1824115.1 hypothetical protein K489DRAFT_378508 [Dissoconium aciculare CBS 342.82]
MSHEIHRFYAMTSLTRRSAMSTRSNKCRPACPQRAYPRLSNSSQILPPEITEVCRRFQKAQYCTLHNESTWS